MDSLDGLKTVIAVVETGSFTLASEKLGISKGLVSKYVSEVERQLDVRLFNRNTRKISLTDAGHNYYRHALKLVENYQLMVDEVVRKQSKPKGLLRVSSPIAFGEHVLSVLIPQFSKCYPEIDVEMVLDNRAVNMLKENIDVRIKSGPVADSNLIARPLCKWPMITCSSPQYIREYGEPRSPADLQHHRCVLDSNLKGGQDWLFTRQNGEQQTVHIRSNISSNNPQAVVNVLKAGGGIGIVARHSVTQEINNGELVEIFSDYLPRILDIFLIYPHRKHIPYKVQCFIDFMLSQLATNQYS